MAGADMSDSGVSPASQYEKVMVEGFGKEFGWCFGWRARRAVFGLRKRRFLKEIGRSFGL